jgi:hypothetical protein
MFGSEILEVAIGIIFIYWLLSLMCSALNEIMASLLSLRAKNLEKGIRNLLNDPKGLHEAKNFYEHSLITSLKNGEKNPSYIPARTFAMALTDMIAKGGTSLSRGGEIRSAVNELSNSRLKKTLLVLMNEAGSQRGPSPENPLQENIEKWFNDMMERVSGWYKRKVQFIIALFAVGLVVLFNADTFMIAKNLLYDAPVRTAIATKAEEMIKPSAVAEKNETDGLSSSVKRIKDLQKDLQTLPLPLGWSELPHGPGDWFMKILGLLFTIIAVSFGAPFWFDILQKILKIHPAQTGKRPESTS